MQKERARQEKQRAKAERKMQRKLENQAPAVEGQNSDEASPETEPIPDTEERPAP